MGFRKQKKSPEGLFLNISKRVLIQMAALNGDSSPQIALRKTTFDLIYQKF
jgi:hypothetical protein